jgi:hypothetical protein
VLMQQHPRMLLPMQWVRRTVDAPIASIGHHRNCYGLAVLGQAGLATAACTAAVYFPTALAAWALLACVDISAAPHSGLYALEHHSNPLH